MDKIQNMPWNIIRTAIEYHGIVHIPVLNINGKQILHVT